MKSRGVLLLGAGGHARACIDVIEQCAGLAVAGLVGQRQERGLQVLGYPVLGSDDDLPTLFASHRFALVALGQIRSAEGRIRLYSLARDAGCEFATAVSSRACVSRHAHIGAGSIVMHGAIVGAGAVVGANCIINSGALIEHDVVVDDHCHVSTMAVLNGGARLGRGSFVGSTAVVREGVGIGAGCFVPMGARVTADCPAGSRWGVENGSL